MHLSFRSRRRLVRMWGGAGRNWRRADRARRRTVLALGRPVAVAWQAWDRFVGWFNALGLSENTILLGFAVAVGVGAALGVVGFYKLIDAAYSVFYRWPGDPPLAGGLPGLSSAADRRRGSPRPGGSCADWARGTTA